MQLFSMITDNLEILESCRKAFLWKQISTILILAVGMTLITAMFAVGYGYSAFSIPFKDAGQLVNIGYPATFMERVILDKSGEPILDGLSSSFFFDLKERKDVFIDLAAYRGHEQERYNRGGSSISWKIMAPNHNVSLIGFDVTDNYFDVLGVSFRGLQEWKQSFATTYPAPMIVTYGTGMKDFGYDVIGKEFDTDSGKITLFGILPEKFLSLDFNAENLGFSPLIINRATTDKLGVVARLAPGVTPQLAEHMLSGFSNNYAPISNDPAASRIIVRSIQKELLKPSQRIAIGAWLIGGLILILCIANVASVYLMRCNYQIREFALKVALGANFLNLIRPLFFELIALSSIAVIIAAMMVQSILAVIRNMVPVTNMAFGKPASGWIVFVFLLACMIIMITVSLTPAVIVAFKNYKRGFNSSHLTMFHRHKSTRILLIISQAAIAMLLLAISNMAVRSYLDLFNKDIGVDSNVLVTTAEYSLKITESQMGTLVNETLETLRGGNPEAHVAACFGNLFGDIHLTLPYDNMKQSVRSMFISPGFVRVVKGKILAGREFNDSDRPDDVVLLNNAYAKAKGWLPQEAVGQIIELMGRTKTVIGVMGDFLNNSWEDDAIEPFVFLPITFYKGSTLTSINYIVHPDALRRTGNIEQIISKSAPETVISRYTTWNMLLNSSASGKILASFIVFIFTITAIIIVVTGIVNTILFTITRRTREIAIHIAIGATYIRVFWVVIRDVVKAGVAGLIFGTLASWWVGKITVHFFYNGARYHGLAELMLMAVLMLLIIITASLVPAFRILRIEISRALASE